MFLFGGRGVYFPTIFQVQPSPITLFSTPYNTSLPPLLSFNKKTIIRVARLALYTNNKVQMANLQAPGQH